MTDDIARRCRDKSLGELHEWRSVLVEHAQTTASEARANGLTVAECMDYATARIAAIDAEIAQRTARD